MNPRAASRLAIAILLIGFPFALAADDPSMGKSAHGVAFDSGPRQMAVKLDGAGSVSFPVTTKSAEAQTFITQGVALIHGFWYFEAERSFRTAAMIDPDCPMAYWGMAFANLDDNEKRAVAFIAEAVKQEAKASPREKLYIDALNAYLTGPKRDDKTRRRDLCSKYEAISRKYPDDLEAKAFLIWQIWDNNLHGMPIESKMAVNALIGEVLAVEPRHPAHHYRIHVTNGNDLKGGLPSAAICGQVAPAVPHMWHMPGHIYVDAKRYADAAWQMEAAFRVENAYRTRMHLTPDEDHLYVHNRGWLIDNLEYAGHVRDAIDLCKQVIDLPRRPGYRSYRDAGKKLFDILVRHERWDELRDLENSDYLIPTDDKTEQSLRLVAFGRGDLGRGDQNAAIARLAKLNDLCEKTRKGFVDTWTAAYGPNHLAGVLTAVWTAGAVPSAADFAVGFIAADHGLRKPAAGAKPDGIRGKLDLLRGFEKAAAELRGHIALSNGAAIAARDWFRQAGDVGPDVMSRVEALGGESTKADELTRDVGGRVYKLAKRVDLLNRVGKTAEARAAFDELRKLAAGADLDDPPLVRLAPLAASYGWPADWRTPVPLTDVGRRPPLDALGPFRWQTWAAPEWAAVDADGRTVRLADHRGRPVIVIFYLGIGCVHCIEQLTAFTPKARDFAAAGIDVIAVGTDSADTIKGADLDGKYPFTVLSDKSLAAFRAAGAFDGFEQMPLHGTFLIDAAGRVRWQDIGSLPFNDADFLLAEAKRLLKSPR
ncbi:MAG TPA: peroxiredoxin family protein [Gemmataceae bacterium]|nr:peroxiredoxin family protein [Gemmataceae bacterium]